MSRCTKSQRRASFETLEQRQLLAGDILINVAGGNLMAQGDALDNKVMITAGSEAGSFVVTGLEGTTVHEEGGAATNSVTVTGVRSIQAELGEGNDLIAVVGANLRGSILLRTGAGDDRVLMGTGGDSAELEGILPAEVSVNVGGSIRIATDGGNDEVSVDDVAVRGHLGVNAGEGDDTVSLGGVEAVAAMVDTIDARLQARGGVHVYLGAGADELTMQHVGTRGAIVVHGGLGDNTVNASRTKTSALLILGDAGVDSVELTDVNSHVLGIHTGDGNDDADVRDSAFAAFHISLGDGNDTLTTAALKARIATMLGGEDEDTFEVVSENSFAHQLIRGFEIPPDINVNELPARRRLLAGLLNRFR